MNDRFNRWARPGPVPDGYADDVADWLRTNYRKLPTESAMAGHLETLRQENARHRQDRFVLPIRASFVAACLLVVASAAILTYRSNGSLSDADEALAIRPSSLSTAPPDGGGPATRSHGSLSSGETTHHGRIVADAGPGPTSRAAAQGSPSGTGKAPAGQPPAGSAKPGDAAPTGAASNSSSTPSTTARAKVVASSTQRPTTSSPGPVTTHWWDGWTFGPTTSSRPDPTPQPTTSTTSTTRAPQGGPTCDGLPATIIGTSRSDVLFGTDGPDVIIGGNGKDTIHGLDGDDVICGGNGADELYGGDGDDRLFGGPARDVLYGGSGDNTLVQ